MQPVRDPEGVEIEYLQQSESIHGRRVLEIGCGDGRLTWRYAATARMVAGVDPDSERLAGAVVARPENVRTPVAFAQAQAEKLPFQDEAFESVILAWSL